MKLRSALVAAFVMTAAPAIAEDLEFNLVNMTSANLVGFYVSLVHEDTWEENLLSGAYLGSGYEVSVLIADGADTCEYDIKAVFEDGDVLEDYGLDLCDMGEYTFTEN